MAPRLAANLAACLARPFVDRASNFLDAFSPPPAFAGLPLPSHVATDASTHLHFSIALEEEATGPYPMQLVTHVRKA